jgi:hypothetical protein
MAAHYHQAAASQSAWEQRKGTRELMTPKDRAKALLEQLDKIAVRRRTALIEAAIRDAENDIIARVSERLESQSKPVSPASAAAIARELMHI